MQKSAAKPTRSAISTLALIRAASRSALGESLRIFSSSSTLRTTVNAIHGAEANRGGFAAFEQCGGPASRITRASQRTASAEARRLSERTRRILGEIGEDNVRTRAADRGERFHHRAVLIEPAVPRRRHDHAELAGDLIRADRHRE